MSSNIFLNNSSTILYGFHLIQIFRLNLWAFFVKNAENEFPEYCTA